VKEQNEREGTRRSEKKKTDEAGGPSRKGRGKMAFVKKSTKKKTKKNKSPWKERDPVKGCSYGSGERKKGPVVGRGEGK